MADTEVGLPKPQTMMNLSGLAVRELVGRAECEPSDVIVVCDDFALPWGMIRVRERGSAGGDNGFRGRVWGRGTGGVSGGGAGVTTARREGELRGDGVWRVRA